jgi:hypothetical protein
MSWYNRRNSFRSYGGFAPYVPVAQRRANAAKAAQNAATGGAVFTPVAIEGRAIAHTFWGKAWCAHQESFSDYANRLPRGRTYVRNGSVIHLAISAGRIEAKVMGSSLYTLEIAVAPLPPQKWADIKTACAGKIDSLVSLLQGRLSEAVMRIVTDQANGLFPSPAETKLRCSCPDSANLCKHLSAVLYGVGARLDTQPDCSSSCAASTTSNSSAAPSPPLRYPTPAQAPSPTISWPMSSASRSTPVPARPRRPPRILHYSPPRSRPRSVRSRRAHPRSPPRRRSPR